MVAEVSVLVRTCGRPEVLRQCLQSICAQDCPDLEIVVVEDGPPAAQEMLEREFGLNAAAPPGGRGPCLVYHSTGARVGRAKAGNLAMTLATGQYFNFLDDDDLFFPGHLTALLGAVRAGPGALAAYDVAQECVCSLRRRTGRYFVWRRFVRFRYPFNRVQLALGNIFPIQTVLFHRSLFEQWGGFQEDYDALEDWDLWMRYAAHTDFVFVDEVNSLYRVPLRGLRRQKKLFLDYDKAVRGFAAYGMTTDFYTVNREINQILCEFRRPWFIKRVNQLYEWLLRR